MKPIKPKIPPPALRAARALLEISQQGVAERAGTSLRSVQLAERGDGTGEDVNFKLRVFYERQGFVFLGAVQIGSGSISECGVRFFDPSVDVATDVSRSAARPKSEGIVFAAARSLLHLTKEGVADGCGLHRKTVAALEAGSGATSKENYDRLLRYFEGQGVEFLGRRDPASSLFHGLGVKLTRPDLG